MLGSEDPLGSRGKYYPYGEDRSSQNPANDNVKFATYTRDSATGLDYADQRYYASTMGRVLTPDRYHGRGGPSPQSWNRYAYTQNDPITYSDPHGTLRVVGSCDYLFNGAEQPGCDDGDLTPPGGGGGGGCYVPPVFADGFDYSPGGPNPSPACYAPPPPQSETPVTYDVQCTITLEWRPLTNPVGNAAGLNHSYIYITFSMSGSDGSFLTFDDLVEGQNVSGVLNAKFYQDFTSNTVGMDPNDHPWDPRFPDIPADAHNPPLVGGADVCHRADGIIAQTMAFKPVPYAKETRNSNWLAWLFLSSNGVNLGKPVNAPGFPGVPLPLQP